MKISYTRAMVDALLNGALDAVEYDIDPVFGFQVSQSCPGVPAEVLDPCNTWPDQARKLAEMFVKNFEKYVEAVPPEVILAGPRG